MGYLIGEKSKWQKTYGDLAAVGEYVNGEPAVIIFPVGKVSDPDIAPSAICMSALFKWTDPRYAAQTAMRMAQAMGRPDVGTAHKIIDIVLNSVDDIVNMPPENRLETDAERRVVAEVSYTTQGVTREREVMAGEFDGQNEITGG